jgi:hypothetical protein
VALVIGTIPPGIWTQDAPGTAVLIPIPPQNGGSVGWGPVYLSFGSDFGDALLRVAVWNSKTGWRISQLAVKSSAGRLSYLIQDGDEKVSVGRLKNSATDTGTCPVGYLIETTLKA